MGAGSAFLRKLGPGEQRQPNRRTRPDPAAWPHVGSGGCRYTAISWVAAVGLKAPPDRHRRTSGVGSPAPAGGDGWPRWLGDLPAQRLSGGLITRDRGGATPTSRPIITRYGFSSASTVKPALERLRRRGPSMIAAAPGTDLYPPPEQFGSSPVRPQP